MGYEHFIVKKKWTSPKPFPPNTDNILKVVFDLEFYLLLFFCPLVFIVYARMASTGGTRARNTTRQLHMQVGWQLSQTES